MSLNSLLKIILTFKQIILFPVSLFSHQKSKLLIGKISKCITLRFSYGLYKLLEIYSKLNFHKKLATLKVGLDTVIRTKFDKVISKFKYLITEPQHFMK